MKRLLTLCAFGALTLLSGCDESHDAVPMLPDQGPTGGEALLSLGAVETPGIVLEELSIALEAVALGSDREPALAPLVSLPNAGVRLEEGFDGDIRALPPAAYSVVRLQADPQARTPLRLRASVGGVTISLEASSFGTTTLRCENTADVADGGFLSVVSTLDLVALRDRLLSAVLTLPIGSTELVVDEASHPALVADVVALLAAEWTVTCELQ